MNLLPNPEKDFLKNGLRQRFWVAVGGLAAFVFLVGTATLLPSYILVRGHFETMRLEENMSLPESDTNNSILNLPNELKTKLSLMRARGGSLDIVENLSKIINLLPKGVVINSVSFNKGSVETGVNASVVLSGLASDRESLVQFGNALKDSKMFVSVDVPVSSLTKGKDLPFSISASLNP